MFDNDKFKTTVYSKSTASPLYLHANSCHKPSSNMGTQKGVALPLRRLCIIHEECKSKAENYKRYLQSRGHETNVFNNTFVKAVKKVGREWKIKRRLQRQTYLIKLDFGSNEILRF